MLPGAIPGTDMTQKLSKSTFKLIQSALYEKFYKANTESESREILNAAVEVLGKENESVEEMIKDFRFEFTYEIEEEN